MFSMRARTLSPSSSFLVRSFGLSGSRWPSFHWPSPRLRFTGADARAVARPDVVGGKAVPPDRSVASPRGTAGFDAEVVGRGARDQRDRQSALLTRRRSTWRRATSRRVSACIRLRVPLVRSAIHRRPHAGSGLTRVPPNRPAVTAPRLTLSRATNEIDLTARTRSARIVRSIGFVLTLLFAAGCLASFVAG